MTYPHGVSTNEVREELIVPILVVISDYSCDRDYIERTLKSDFTFSKPFYYVDISRVLEHLIREGVLIKECKDAYTTTGYKVSKEFYELKDPAFADSYMKPVLPFSRD